MQDRSLRQQDSLQKETATHSGILAWEIPWKEEPGGESMGCKRVRHNLVTKQQHVVTEPLSHLPAPSFQHQLAETAEPNSTEVSLQH